MPWNVFYSYSHKDEKLRNDLATSLALLKQNGQIVEWHDRKIQPGTNWDKEISSQIYSADLVLALVSPDFLASQYCFGVEMDAIFKRLKQGSVRLIPILLRPCLWEESVFSALQMIPRDAQALTSWPSADDALLAVAKEILRTVSDSKPTPFRNDFSDMPEPVFDSSLDLVRKQIRAYARLYEKTRQRNRASSDRTKLMEQIFQSMRTLATASYPLLTELRESPSPGERLAAVSILQVFSDENSLEFLVNIVGSEKPFIGYHATKALRFAVGAMDSTSHSILLSELTRARTLLNSAAVGFDADRQRELIAAESELHHLIASNSSSGSSND